ncbi:MAG: ribonuclease G [Oceanospirillaceae bacterium]|nr:ribonuclease G [Oceanospirillaceae bacterium]
MNEEILINFSPMETRVAVIENGMLQEVHLERNDHRGIVGNIYLGKVVRVLPGMQAAFVEIGLERSGFIHAADIAPKNGQPDSDDIALLVREGQSILVQVLKDPMGTKGARLSTQISIPSRYLVYMPGTAHVGVSSRIEDDTEKQRLKHTLEHYLAQPSKLLNETPEQAKEGVIVRTVAEGVNDLSLHHDIDFLRRLWITIKQQISKGKAPQTIYEDLPLALRALRDIAHPQIEKIRIDSKETFQKATEFVNQLVPDMASKLEHYPGERPIFDLYNVEDEIRRALGRKVLLKSGGYIIIDQTEAMTTVDVNTGAYVGHRNLEETIFKTNLEAATAIGRQLRLRNLGGIIILDLIDMHDPEHQRQVARTLDRALAKDHVKTKVLGVSDLGLIQMTRKRTRESLEQLLCEPCSACDGSGINKTPETICYEIFREILRAHRAYDTQTYLILASQAVIDQLLDEEAHRLAELESFIGKTISLRLESMYTNEQYDVVLR